MSEFNNWFGVRFPNIQATIDQTNDQESKLLKLCCKEVWQHQQAIISDLKTQLNNMESCYIGKKKQVEDVSHMLEGDLKYVEQDLRGNFEFLKMAMIRCLGDAIKTLRGAND